MPWCIRALRDSERPPDAKLQGVGLILVAREAPGEAVAFVVLQQQNLIVPLVGDFAGGKTLAAVGQFLKDRGATASYFYVSNVERYLFDQGDDTKKFYDNVAALPRDAASVFIRSITSDISRRLGIPILDNPAKWRSYVAPINANLKSFADGRIVSYRDLF